MELKGLILETLNELSQPNENSMDLQKNISIHTTPISTPAYPQNIPNIPKTNESLREEYEFLEMLQERLLVLFEGLNAPQNHNLQTKLSLTINFLEYQLSIIAERLNDLRK